MRRNMRCRGKSASAELQVLKGKWAPTDGILSSVNCCLCKKDSFLLLEKRKTKRPTLTKIILADQPNHSYEGLFSLGKNHVLHLLRVAHLITSCACYIFYQFNPRVGFGFMTRYCKSLLRKMSKKKSSLLSRQLQTRGPFMKERSQFTAAWKLFRRNKSSC